MKKHILGINFQKIEAKKQNEGIQNKETAVYHYYKTNEKRWLQKPRHKNNC